ncbi:MAG: VanZ family protein [Anaerolineae bacterium]|jgi:VanZ family protein|nr:VanZ family protein [Anaerolineae bacterium]
MVARLRRSIALRWAAVIAWMGVIFFLSSRPDLPNFAPGLPGVEELGGHLTAYGVLAGLLWWALRGSGVRYPATWALVLAVAYGVSDEFHQSFVPGRDMSVSDLMVDLLGAGVALLLLTLLQARRMGMRSAGRVP